MLDSSYVASQPKMDNTAVAATSDDIAHALLNDIRLGELLLGGPLEEFSPVAVSGVSPAPVDDEFCSCSDHR